jgi:predicted RNA-binding Zn-ribbon protein involved in translation (DUF1610 family)
VLDAALCKDSTPQKAGGVLLGDIARAHGAALRRSHVLTPEQHAVLRAIERCRTAALGGHMHACDSCGYAVPMYNSCRNRHCPTCQSLEQHKWLERRRDTILPVPYFHLVFTLPSELRPVVAMNRERMFALMFEAASKTVLILSRDKKRLGGMPAVTMVLHTWTRELAFHPHVHAIVSAGALNDEGEWLESRQNFLFPVKVMARLFRRLFREALLKAFEADELTVRAEHDAPMRRALFETKWNVYAKAPFGGAEQVYSYLGRYTHRVGISNARILRADDQRVEFATKNGRTCSLAPVEFLHRFLLHVLPKGFHKIRHYGLCSTHHVAAGTIGKVRALLQPTALARADSKPNPSTAAAAGDAEPAKAPETWEECVMALTGIDVLRCPRCAEGRLVRCPLDEHALHARRDTS